MPHKKILYKLNKYGISGDWQNSVYDFLNNRRACVQVNPAQSDWESVISSVPQASILGTFLFRFHINDLPSNVIAKLLFADVTTLIKMLSVR